MLRNLTDYELDLVAGGQTSSEIVAFGYDPYVDWQWYFDMFNDPYSAGSGVGGVGSPDPQPVDDSASHDITVNFPRALTEPEQQAVNAFNAEMQKITNTINALSNNAKITLSNGSQVTGAELKDIWAATDFEINDKGHIYANGSNRGEANYNFGDPIVRVNIDTLVGYSNLGPSGLDYLALHELGHLTASGRAFNAVISADGQITTDENDANERLANDIAKAIANQGGFPIIPNPGSGYSPSTPTFQTSTSSVVTGLNSSSSTYYENDLPLFYAKFYWNAQLP